MSDWRDVTMSRMRELILAVDPEIVEERKWAKASNPDGVPVWSCEGIICTGETYKDKVKLTFARGASVDDPSGLFNASLEGNARRAIDIGEREQLDEAAFQALIRAAIEANAAARAARKR